MSVYHGIQPTPCAAHREAVKEVFVGVPLFTHKFHLLSFPLRTSLFKRCIRLIPMVLLEFFMDIILPRCNIALGLTQPQPEMSKSKGKVIPLQDLCGPEGG